MSFLWRKLLFSTSTTVFVRSSSCSQKIATGLLKYSSSTNNFAKLLTKTEIFSYPLQSHAAIAFYQQRSYHTFSFSSPSSSGSRKNKKELKTTNTRKVSAMPPIQSAADNKINDLISTNPVMVFSKSYCPYCNKVKTLLADLEIQAHYIELDLLEPAEGATLSEALKKKSGQSTVPNVFINGKHIGGCDDTFNAHKQFGLLTLVKGGGSMDESATEGNYDYDLIVIGGGSGGLAASKEAAKLGKNVAVFDFVKPSPIGTTWGLGGTCVNVGCIPKKLMHQAALLGTAMDDAEHYGWKGIPEKIHDWPSMIEGIQNYIGSLNWGYRVSLKDAKATYLNEFVEFEDDHTIISTNKKGVTKKVTGGNFIVAVGGRPRYPDILGAKEYGITSDDLFSLPHNPGKTLIIGASYIALECAGFLSAMGIETTVMVRSILLRGFDQQIAEMIGSHMEEDHGIKFLRGFIPKKIVKDNDDVLTVTAKEAEGDTEIELKINTIIFAIGRDPCTSDLKLEKAGVKISSKSGKIYTNTADQTSASNIYAVGDVAEDRPELTPAAIQAGKLLARRLYSGEEDLTDYENIPTTVFTPLEYGCIGLSEEAAIDKYGADDIEVYHSNFQPLECTLPKRDENKCYAKLVCVKSLKERVVGFHYLGPHAGEVTQGFAIGIRLGATKKDFNMVIGIHPTSAETFTTMEITKSSGVSSKKTGC